MGINLRILILLLAVFLTITTFVNVYKRKIPVRYALIWFFISGIFYILGLVPEWLLYISKLCGFEVMSNLVIGIFIAVLLFITFLQTIMISRLKDRIIALTQEVGLINEKK